MNRNEVITNLMTYIDILVWVTNYSSLKLLPDFWQNFPNAPPSMNYNKVKWLKFWPVLFNNIFIQQCLLSVFQKGNVINTLRRSCQIWYSFLCFLFEKKMKVFLLFSFQILKISTFNNHYFSTFYIRKRQAIFGIQ